MDIVESTDWRTTAAPPWDEPDVEDRPIPGERYTSTSFFQQEWEGMWTRVWLLLGRANDMPRPGDYQMEEVGPESFLLVRQADDSIRAFYNVCQHRGSRLSFAERGRVDRFVCPYHGWEWATDGALLDAPDAEDFAGGNPCEHVRLEEVACDTFGGFVFVNMDPSCDSLTDFLGPLVADWSRYGMNGWKRYTALTARVECNWKVIQDNFCESYHLPMVHRQLETAYEESYRYTRFDLSTHGHNRMVMTGATPSSTLLPHASTIAEPLAGRLRAWDLDPADFDERVRDARRALQSQMRELGPARGHAHYENLRDEQLTDAHHYNLFPNCSLTFGADGVLLQRMRPHATDPQQCVFDHWYYAFPPSVEAGVQATTTNVRIDGTGVQHEVFDYGDRPMGIIPDQDIAVTTGQQLGLRSRGFRGGHLAGQERRVRWLHQVIDEYIAGQRP